ncbi:MAG: hypothetical protein JO342_08865 [Solirubrobacterales bacterium]|nr:hypothetical protein [Solirubrobacterales bacterium]
MGQRSRKRGRRSKPTSQPQQAAVAVRPASRSEEKNAAVRATLEPYGAGERPWPIRFAVVVAILIGVGDLVDVLVGGKLGFGDTHPGKGGVILFSVLMLVAAAGMWRMKYWAVLGFQAILAFVVLFFSLALIRASNFAAVAIGVGVVCGGGYLFYKLVRVLSRIQLPRRPGQ